MGGVGVMGGRWQVQGASRVAVRGIGEVHNGQVLLVG